MGKYRDLFMIVSLGERACSSKEDCQVCNECPYSHLKASNKCMPELAKDRRTVVQVMTYLDQLNKEVEPI